MKRTYKQLLTETRPSFMEVNYDVRELLEEENIDEVAVEVVKALKGLKCNKAPDSMALPLNMFSVHLQLH